MAERVLGLDLSLRATGMVIVPSDWGLDWSRVIVGKAGSSLPKDAPEADRSRRVQKIRNAIREFIAGRSPTAAVLEQYAFSATDSQAHALGELGGVVKLDLVEQDIPIQVVSPASVRKLLGKAPRKDVKIWAATRLYAAGAPKTWTLDQCDAFLAANFYLSGMGGDAIVLEAA